MSYATPSHDWLNEGRLWAIEFIDAVRLAQSGFFQGNNMFFDPLSSGSNMIVNYGRNRTLSGSVQLSFWTQAAAGNAQAFISRGSGTNGDMEVSQSGTGNLNIRHTTANGIISIRALGGRIQFTQNNVEVAKIDGVNTIIYNNLLHAGSRAGFFGAADITKPTVTGSRGGNAALNSALIALANLGLLTNSSSA